MSDQNLAWLAAIVKSSDDAIVSKTLDGMVTSWNRGAEQIFGYSLAEMIGRPITAIFPPDRIAEEAEFLERLARGERIDHYDSPETAISACWSSGKPVLFTCALHLLTSPRLRRSIPPTGGHTRSVSTG